MNTSLLQFQGVQSDHLLVERTSYIFPRELMSFIRPRELYCFDTRHVVVVVVIIKTLFKHGKSSVQYYKLKAKTISFTTALHDCRVGIRYVGYLLEISLKLINRSDIFLSYRASYSITWPRYMRSYVLNNWFSVSAMPVFPQSFSSCN